jgi:ABC-type glycerol-3-phosphate transport system substrate-binding protein
VFLIDTMLTLRSFVAALAVLALITSGCQMTPPSPSTPAPRATATPPGRPATPTPVSAPAQISPGPATLTVWLPDTLVPAGNAQANTTLMQQINAFAATQSDLRAQVLTKRAHGPGGILDLMRTAASVAPSVLPDVTLLDLDQVQEAAQAGLLRPLNDLVPDEVLADLFPFAASVGRLDNQWLAVAYAVDMEHLAYNAARVPAPPLTWAQALSGSYSYLFPAGAVGGMPADGLFAQYAAAGGKWLNESSQPSLDATALAQMLRQLKDAQQVGVVSPNVLNFVSADDTWLAYLGSATQVVDVRASRFIAQRTAISGTLAAPLPGRAEPAQLIARGWALVIPARDPDRISVAASLITWLIAAENQGAWARSASLLPTRQAAFNYWYPPDAYTVFVRQELGRAIPPPPARVAQVVGPAIQKAVADVLRGQAQPAEAAKSAVESVARASK